jgi:hypothetical protein
MVVTSSTERALAWCQGLLALLGPCGYLFVRTAAFVPVKIPLSRELKRSTAGISWKAIMTPPKTRNRLTRRPFSSEEAPLEACADEMVMIEVAMMERIDFMTSSFLILI